MGFAQESKTLFIYYLSLFSSFLSYLPVGGCPSIHGRGYEYEGLRESSNYHCPGLGVDGLEFINLGDR